MTVDVPDSCGASNRGRWPDRVSLLRSAASQTIMPKRHGCASIMVLGRFERKREAGGRWSLKLRKHITNKQRIGENENESDTNSPIRRTRSSGTSRNATPHNGSR